MEIFGPAFDNLENALDIYKAKHSVIAGNIANVDTPGYKAKEIDFKDAFSGALQRSGIAMRNTNERHFRPASITSSASSYMREQVNNSLRNDGNNVNVDKEMMALSENSIMYDIATQAVSRNFESLKFAISQGRR